MAVIKTPSCNPANFVPVIEAYPGGALFATVCDRAQEFCASLAQLKIAASQGDNAGRHLQLAFAASSVLPSLTISTAEAKGIVVAERGLGSRHTRVTLKCLGYFWNEHPARVRALGGVSLAFGATSLIEATKTSYSVVPTRPFSSPLSSV